MSKAKLNTIRNLRRRLDRLDNGGGYTASAAPRSVAQYVLHSGVRAGATIQPQEFVTGIIDDTLTAGRLVATSDENRLASVSDLTDWIEQGSSDQVLVTDDGDGTITLALPQDINTTSEPTFGGLTIDGGAIELINGAVYERHIQIPAFLAGTPANQPTQVDFGTCGGLQFPSSGSRYAFIQWEVPDDWNGDDVYIEVDWFPDSGAMSGTDAVRWVVEYRAIGEGETITNGTVATISNGAGGDTSDYAQYQTKHSRMTLPYNDANQPLTVQDHVYFKITRDTAVANDFAGTVTVPAFEIIYNSAGFPTSN